MILAAALVLLGVVALAALVLLAVALSDGNDASNTASRSTAPPTTIPTVKVLNLVGMSLTRAKAILAARGLRGTI